MNLTYDKLLSNIAFNCNVQHYDQVHTTGMDIRQAPAARAALTLAGAPQLESGLNPGESGLNPG